MPLLSGPQQEYQYRDAYVSTVFSFPEGDERDAVKELGFPGDTGPGSPLQPLQDWSWLADLYGLGWREVPVDIDPYRCDFIRWNRIHGLGGVNADEGERGRRGPVKGRSAAVEEE